MKLIYLSFFIVVLSGCETVNEALGLEKKVFNEYTITTNNELQYPPEHLELKPYNDNSSIDNSKKGEEILFGDGVLSLDEDIQQYQIVSEGEKSLLNAGEVIDNPFAPQPNSITAIE